MNISEYRKTRENSMKLVHIFIEKLPKENIQYAGKMLGLLEDGVLVFDEENDSSVLMDYCIYEKNPKGKRFIDEFYDSDIKLKDHQEILLEAMVDSNTSLFEVQEVNYETAHIVMKNLLDETKDEFILMDLGLSQTAKLGMVFFTRIITIGDVFMSSGVSFVFANKGQILKDISLAKFKKNGKLGPNELYILMYKRFKSHGVKVLSREI